MIQLNFWFFLVVFIAVDIVAIACYIIGQGIGKAKMIDGMMARVEGMKGPDGKDAKFVTELRELLDKIARGEKVPDYLK